jgi:AcrR family transcriptional regulator
MAEKVEATESHEMDGRRARSMRARLRIAEAVISLHDEGNVVVTAEQVAERAGVSTRTVYHHFADREALLGAGINLQSKKYFGAFEQIPRELPFNERLEALLARRSRLYEAITPVRRAAVLAEPTSTVISNTLREIRTLKRGEVTFLFEAEIMRRPLELREETAAAVGQAFSWWAWESFRRHQGLGPERARAAVRRLVLGVLS